LQEIEVPNQSPDDVSFQEVEEKFWQRYTDKKGKLRTITRTRLSIIVFVIALPILLAVVLVTGWQRDKLETGVAAFIQMTGLKRQPPAGGQQSFLLKDGSSAIVDLRRNLKRENKQLYLPTTKQTAAGKDSLVFLPARLFRGDSTALGNHAFVRSFIPKDDDKMYFLCPVDPNVPGSWIPQRALKVVASLGATDERKTSSSEQDRLTLRLTRAAKLRKTPSTSGDFIKTVPESTNVQLMKIGPLAPSSFWIYVLYDSSGHTSEGWMAAFYNKKQFIETIEP
jgi:hypothetical protein